MFDLFCGFHGCSLGCDWCCPCLLSLKSTICAIILAYSLAFIRFQPVFDFSPLPEMDRIAPKPPILLAQKGIGLNLHHQLYKKVHW